MAENPYELSEATAAGSTTATGSVVTWPRIGVTASIALVVIAVLSVPLMRFTLLHQIELFQSWARALGGTPGPGGIDFPSTLVFLVTVLMPYIFLNLIVFLAVLRWICRPRSRSHP